MSFPQVEGVHPRLAEFGSTVEENDGGRGSSASYQAITKIRIVGPTVSKRVSRGPTRAIRRPISDYTNLHTESHDHHNKPLDTDMMNATTARDTKTTQPSTPETDDDDDIAFSPLNCESPIPPLPRARIPSRLGAVSAQPCEPHELGEPLTQDMMLIGRPASAATYNRMCVPLDDRRRIESGLAGTPLTSILSDGREMSGRITSIEEHLKPLLLCQSMGVKIETKSTDFVPGTIAQIVFHCPRCLKHWKLSGKPKAPSECKESHQPTRGPEYDISIQSHPIMQELEKLSGYSKQQLINVLSRTGSPGTDEELLELVNSASSSFLQESSTSPHASRWSRSPEKRSMIRFPKDSNSPSPVEKFHKAAGLHEEKRSRSANQKSDSTKLRKGATSARVKSSVHDALANTPNAQNEQKPTLTSEAPSGKEDNLNKKEDKDTIIGKGEIRSNMKDPYKEQAKVYESVQSNLEDTQLTPGDQDLDGRIPDKPPERKNIPSGEISSTGQSIVEFEDIDGTAYHGFMSPIGNFVPIARVDHTGNRLPIAMKPDGGICIVRRYGSRALDLPLDDTEESQVTSNTDKGIIEVKDRTGAIVRGYENLSGQFVPLARIDEAGLEHAVVIKTDGKFYVQSESNSNGVSCDEVVILSGSQHEIPDESSVSHQAVVSHGQTTLSCQTVQKKSEDTSITEVENHDGFKYQGFDSPGFGFIPTARIDPDGSRRPVVMNADGEYTLVNGNGRMISVHLQCKSDYYQDLKCTGCRFLSKSQSLSRILFNTLSNTSSDSSDGATFLSASQVDLRKGAPNRQSDVDSIIQVDHWVKTDGTGPKSERSSHKVHHMTYKREPDGSVYHGCCQSGQFVPVFRLDERGCRYPVLKDSGGKYYTIDKDGHNRYADNSRNKFVTRELNGYTFEGRHTVDGRFVPMSYLDDQGNRKAVMQSRNGQYLFSGRNGQINFVKFLGTKNELNPISGFNPTDNRNEIRIGDDGLKYEGYTDGNGEFVPTVRVDKSGYRQMILLNAQDQGYVIGYDGQLEFVPFTIPQKLPKLRTKRKKLSQTPSGKAIKSKCYQSSSEDESVLLGSDMTQLCHMRIKPQSESYLFVQHSEGDSSEKYEKNGRNLPLSDELSEQMIVGEEKIDESSRSREEDHDTESQVKGARTSSGISLTNHVDGTVIYRKKAPNEPSQDMKNIPKLPGRTSHSGDYPSKPEESAAIAGSLGTEDRKSAGVREDIYFEYPEVKDSKRTSFKEAAERVVHDIKNIREHRDVKGKPIVKNIVVSNVTRRPDTKAGQFRKQVFATPKENLTHTLALGKGQLESQDTPSTNVEDPSELSNTDRMLQQSDLYNKERAKLRPSELSSGETKLPSLPKNQGLPPLGQGEWEANSEAQETSSEQGSDSPSLALSLPEPDPLDRAHTLPPVGHKQRKVQKVDLENLGKVSQASSADICPEVETNDANDFKDQSRSSEDFLNKYSKFKLTADRTLSPSPPLLSDKEPTYRMMYSTIPSHLRSSSPPPQSIPVPQTISGEQSKSPEPILFKKESSIVHVSTLPVNRDEVMVPSPKVSSPILMKDLLQPSPNTYRSRTSLANRSSNHLLGAKGCFSNSINKIWQQHKGEVELLHQTFYLPLTNAFSFSMFELPEQYKEHNCTIRQKAKQIQKMKKPTKLGKPPQIMQKQRHHPLLKKIPKPLQTIPYRIKAKMAKA